MRKTYKSSNVRFCMEDENQRRTWEYLQSLTRKDSSYGKALSDAFVLVLDGKVPKRYIIDLKIRPYFEKKILSEITVADVRAWQNELLMYKDKNGKGYSQTYLKTINCQLTAIFNYAIRYYAFNCWE